jgi:hypothetical protein
MIASPHLRYVRRVISKPRPDIGENVADLQEVLLLQQRFVENITGDNGEWMQAYVWKDVPIVDETDARRDMVA